MVGSVKGRDKNTLGFSKKVQLYNWVKANQGMLLEKKATYGVAASFASSALGFVVTEGNLKSICRELKMKFRGNQGGNLKLYGNLIGTLARAVAELQRVYDQGPDQEILAICQKFPPRIENNGTA